MIKILHIYKTFIPETMGGVEQCILQMSKNPKIQSRVLCLTPKNERSVSVVEGVEVVRYPQTLSYASCPISLQALLHFRQEAEWADIIHYHYPWPFADLLFLFAGKKKSVVTYHSDIVKQKLLRLLYYPLEQYFLAKMDRIIATSPNYAKTSPNLLKYKDKAEIIPIGIDYGSYPKAKPEKKYGDRFFLFIGQLRYYKGLDVLFEAIAGTDLQLVVIGDGPSRAKLAKTHKNVHFLGQVDEQQKSNLLAACLCVVLPSHLRSEAFGIALVEGAMFDKPLICCEIGTGTSHINKHMETGLVVPPNDASALRAAMLKMLGDQKLAKKMGQAAKNRYNEFFTAKTMRDRLTKLYKSL